MCPCAHITSTGHGADLGGTDSRADLHGTDNEQIINADLGGTDNKQISRVDFRRTDDKQITGADLRGTDNKQISRTDLRRTDNKQISRTDLHCTDNKQISRTDLRRTDKRVVGGPDGCVMADGTGAQDRKTGTTEGLSRLARIAGTVVAPVTAITALMVYFGWARANITYYAFGIHYSVLGFSFQDYLFRSIEATFKPAAVLLLVILVAVPAHLGLAKLVERGWWRRTVLPVVAAGGSLTVIGLLGFLDLVTYRVAWPLIPMSLGLGVLLIGYAMTLWRAASGTQLRPLGDSDIIDIVTRVAFAAFLTLTLVWSVAVYATIRGLADAQQIARRPASLPGVVVFAPRPLHLSGAGIRQVVLIDDQESRYYRYDGLRLLVRASDRYILLPEKWRPGMRTVVISDDPTVRLEFYVTGP